MNAPHRTTMQSNALTTLFPCYVQHCKIVYEIFVAHFRELRTTADFQTNWLRFMTILATNSHVAAKGSPLHSDLFDMIVALLRLLQPDPLPSNFGKSHDRNDVPHRQSSSPNSYQISPKCDKTSQTLISKCCFTPDNRNPVPEIDDELMLRLSWRALASVYPALPAIIRSKYPMIRHLVSANDQKGDVVRLLSTPTNKPSTPDPVTSSRTSTTRLLDAKTYIV